jgi:hypothetical protein
MIWLLVIGLAYQRPKFLTLSPLPYIRHAVLVGGPRLPSKTPFCLLLILLLKLRQAVPTASTMPRTREPTRSSFCVFFRQNSPRRTTMSPRPVGETVAFEESPDNYPKEPKTANAACMST